MNNILIMDTETNGVDPLKNQVIEIAGVLWNVDHRCIVEVYSGLLPAPHNEAEHINRIPHKLVEDLPMGDAISVWASFMCMATSADAFLAHNAEFDKKFVSMNNLKFANSLPWICSIEDFEWPIKGESSKLINIALEHGIAITSAHRALQDCLILARLFESIPDIDERMQKAYDHSLVEKHVFIANVTFAQRETAKAHGFRWNPDNKTWWKRMTAEDTEHLPFKTRKKG